MPRPPAKTQPAPAEPVEVAQTNGHIEMAEIPFRGTVFHVPKDRDEWDIEACLALGEDNYFQAAKLLLGPAQWRALLTLGSKRSDIRDFLQVLGPKLASECYG